MHGSCTGAWRVLAAAVSLTACGPTEAADGAGGFPSRPVRFIVPFSAGSQTDILARIDKPWDVVVMHGFSTLDQAHPGHEPW